MERRLEFHDKLCETLGSSNCYFNPPETIKLKYPCIVYNRHNKQLAETKYANDVLYGNIKSYTVTVIDHDPDSSIPDQLLEDFMYCSYDRWFVFDELHHWVFRIYY